MSPSLPFFALGHAVLQTIILFGLPPSPFDKPASPANIFIYGLIAASLVIAWTARRR